MDRVTMGFRRTIGIFTGLLFLLFSVFMFAVNIHAAAVAPESGNIYYIKNKNSGMYLTVENDGSSAGANVIQYKGTGSLGQRWILEQNSNGSYRLHPATDMTGGLSLDVAYGSGDDGTNIQIWSNNGLSPQNFGLAQVDDGYAITTECTGHASCVDVKGAKKSSGTNIIQYQNKGSANQIWYFEEAPWPDNGGSSSGSSSEETVVEEPVYEEPSYDQGQTGSSSSMSSKSWNMSDMSFRNLGKISSSTEIDGLKLLANSGKTMSIQSSPAQADGNNFDYCLALGGSGSTSYRAVSLDISGTTTVKVTAKSSGSSTRTLAIVNGSGDQVGTIDCSGSLATGSVTINGNGTIYIYSKNSGINIYKVQIDTTGTVPGSSGSSSSQGSSNSGSSSNQNESTPAQGSSNVPSSSASGAIDADGYPDQLMELVCTSDGYFVGDAGSYIAPQNTSSVSNRWKIAYVSNGCYQLINAATGKAMSVNGSSVAGASPASNAAQYWNIVAVKNDANGNALNYKIVCYSDSNKALTLSSGKYTVSTFNGSAAQQFRFNSHGAEGFAGYSKTMNGSEKASVTGGVLGKVVNVSSVSELQNYASGSTAYTIVIKSNLSQSSLTKVNVGKNKTIVGRFGAGGLNNIHFRCINGSGNVIFKNITFSHDSSKNANDDIQMYISNGNNYWLDHCTFKGHSSMTSSDVDKHVYVGLNSDYVSITGCYFGGHKYGLILGYPEEDGASKYSGYPRMTIANNYFYNNYTRAPGLMRYGYFHCYNNYVYGFNLGYTPYTGCNIYSEKNCFEKGSYAGKVVDDHGVGAFTDSGSILSSSVSGLKTGGTSWRPSSNYGYATRSASDAKNWAKAYAGAQSSKIVYAID